MKILILQLARFGDIYMSWPALRAIRRVYPNAEIHFLTRTRFSAANENLEVVDYFWQLDTAHLLEPIQNDDFTSSLGRIDTFIKNLRSKEFSWIINLTFSPTSSYIVHALSLSSTRVSGYSRDKDGFLYIADPASGYFYAQVGVGRHNRIHLTDIFSAVIGIDYEPEDWRAPIIPSSGFQLPQKFITIHIGASDYRKRLLGFQWVQILRELRKRHSELSVVLIGAVDEFPIAAEIEAQMVGESVLNLVGQTKLRDLFGLLSYTELLVGCDSAPVHIAALTDTPVYNISLGNVNFWETGPKSSLAFVERFLSTDSIQTKNVAESIISILENRPHNRLICRHDGMESYMAPQTPNEAFMWDFIKALYFDGPFPISDDYSFYQAAVKIRETADVVVNSIHDLYGDTTGSLARILETSDEILKKIGKLNPKVQPLLWWLESQKVMIRPGSVVEVARETLEIYKTLKKVVGLYIPADEVEDQGGSSNG